jgi:hypothetical protein
MNKEAIRKTAICYWSEEDKAYVVESPLFETIAGVGTTEKESRKIFDNLLDDAYEAYLEGRVPGYEKAGRTAKGRIALNADVKPEAKQFIKNLADDFQCSQGEIIDFLVCAYQREKDNRVFSYANADRTAGSNKQWLAVCEKMDDIKNSVDYLETELPNMFSYQTSAPSKRKANVRSRKQRP